MNCILAYLKKLFTSLKTEVRACCIPLGEASGEFGVETDDDDVNDTCCGTSSTCCGSFGRETSGCFRKCAV